MKTSIFGSTGFVGGRYCTLFPDEVIKIHKDQAEAETNEILYLISTTDNYNVFSDPHLDLDVNLNLLVSTLKRNKNNDTVFNFVSSWFVYGDTDLPAKEDSICNPKGFYSITKRCAEQLLISWCETFGIRYRIFRLANVYGVGDRGVGRKKNALLYLIDKMSKNEPIELYYNGYFIRDYIHVDDVCKTIHHLMRYAPHNTVVNIGSGQAYTFRHLISYAHKKLQSESEITATPPPEFHRIVQVKDMYLDVSRIKSWGIETSKFIPIEQGLNEYIESLKHGK